tara:strand:+ start:1129 stop:1467 length:339 start_codon:yes stop_codon:yes gene_type:complete
VDGALSEKPKTARSYRATVVGDNTVVSINLKWAGQVLVLVAGLVYSYLQIENRIKSLEQSMVDASSEISDLMNKHIIEEEAKIAQMQQELDWYEKELNLNPLSWGKKKRKKK